MRKRPLCSCGSGLAAEHCCEKFQVRSFALPFTETQTREKILQKLKIGSEFGMRNRAITFFYGDDLIAYKLCKPKDKPRNEFLYLLSNYLTDYLEDLCPPSWQDCTPLFWEEFISTFIPGRIPISKTGHETEKLLTELKKFVRWLDRRAGTSWLGMVENFINLYAADIKTGETALNALFLLQFPHFFEKDFDMEKDLEARQRQMGPLTQTADGLFEVRTMINGIYVLYNLEDDYTYHTKGLPDCVLPGLMLKGAIGKKKDDFFWNWFVTGAIFPQCSKKFLETENAVIIL